MLSYLQYLNLPTKVVMVLVGVFLVMQIIGELLEFRGKVVPEYFKIRKYIKRKKDDREAMRQVPETLKEVRELLDNVNKHYSEDNIALRDQWIKDVNEKLEIHDQWKEKFDEKLDRTITLLLSAVTSVKSFCVSAFACFGAFIIFLLLCYWKINGKGFPLPINFLLIEIYFNLK